MLDKGRTLFDFRRHLELGQGVLRPRANGDEQRATFGAVSVYLGQVNLARQSGDRGTAVNDADALMPPFPGQAREHALDIC